MRLNEFQQWLREKKISFALLLSTDSSKENANMRYFSDYNGIGALVIPARKKPFLIVPEMEYERARRGRIKVVMWKKKKRLFELVKGEIRRRGINAKRVGIEKRAITLAEYSALKKMLRGKKSDISRKCAELRAIKTKEEIRRIRKSCRIADGIMNGVIKEIKQGRVRTEAEAAAFLGYEARKKGCELAFEPIVASGIGSREPHYRYGKIKLRKGFCVVDFGVRHKGYCSDMTRTIYIGKPGKSEREAYEAVLKAQEGAIREVKAEKMCREIYNVALKALGRYGKNFSHGLGHGIGLMVHELPNLSSESRERIKEGMVVTVEPGVYTKRFGIRIEDDVVIVKGRAEVLTRAPKKMIVC